MLASDGINTSSDTVGPLEISQNPTLSVAGSVSFPSVPLGRTADVSLVVANSGAGPLIISSMTTDQDEFSVRGPGAPVVIPGGSQTTLTLRYHPSSSGAASSILTIASNDAARPSVTVQLNAGPAAATDPTIKVGPSSLDFGNVIVGRSAAQSITISNAGDADLSVTSFVIGNAAVFSLPTAPFTLPPGVSKTLSVQFAPAVNGAQSAFLRVKNHDRNVVVALYGAGFMPVPSTLAANPVSLDFGSAIVGATPPTRTITIRNTGALQSP